MTVKELLKRVYNEIDGLDEEIVGVIISNLEKAVLAEKAKQEAKRKLEEAKAQIENALAGIDVPNYDVRVRGGKVEVRLVGTQVRGRKPRSSKSISMEELVRQYLPDRIDEYLNGDKDTRYRLAKEALEVKNS